MALLDDIRSHLAVANEDQRKRRGAVLLREAAAEIERLRAIMGSEPDRPQAADILAALRSSGEAGDLLCLHAADEIERLRLTSDEREAIREAATAYADNDGDDSRASIAAALFRLLERTRG